ncbi:CHAT domain containing protein [Nitzschia inconspicua]|uniref:CHAT domain containing protein n=1 Tax=Nitzschia inconspicua TaxID=303405 RepID=A0A9K3LBX5_9STRA|nr:CHAT domain containing protein [Nitzschia inconspicua]
MNVMNDYGVVLSGHEIVEYARRRGLCQLCGRTQTHKRPNNLFKKLRNQWEPLTIMDQGDDDAASGNQMYLVYKGFCLQPTCYTLEEAKVELGEIVLEPCDASHRSVNSKQISQSMRRFSSAKFSMGSGTSYEFSVPDPQTSNSTSQSRLLRPNQLFSTSSTLSDVSSLGASAISEDNIEEEEEDNPFFRDFLAPHIMAPKSSGKTLQQQQQQPSELDWVADFFPFPQTSTAAADRPVPSHHKFASETKSLHVDDDETDSMSQSETTEGDENSKESFASQVAPCALHQKPASKIILPAEYDVNVSKNCSNILTIQRGSLEALELITNVCGGIDLQRQFMNQLETDHEEGFEIAFADDMVTQEFMNEIEWPENGTQVDLPAGKEAKNAASKPSTMDHLKEPSVHGSKTGEDAVGVLTLFQSAPLAYVHPETRQKYTFPLLDFAYESQMLTQSLQDAERIGSSVRVETEIATVDRLSAFFAQGGRKVLHLSCHGHPEYLLLENGYGSAHPLLVKELKRFVSQADLDLVFVSACYSRSAGEAFLQAGVKHVVCCRQDSVNVRDEAAAEFARHFYRALACQKTLKEAFELAKATVRVSPLFPNAEEESDKFLLLPEDCDRKYHDIQISFRDERRVHSCSNPEQSSLCFEMLNRAPERFIGREEELFQVIDAIRCTDWLHVLGERGVGKTTLVAAASAYISRRPSSFMRDRIIWIKGPNDAKRYKKSIRQANATRPLVIFDTRVEADGWGQPKQMQFLLDLFGNGTKMKLITIGYDESFVHRLKEKTPVSPRTLRVGRLSHNDSVCLFACLASSDKLSPQELASTLSMSDPNQLLYEFQDDNSALDPIKMVTDALHNFRKKKVYHRIGEGLPKRIVHFAASMDETELAECIRWANRQSGSDGESPPAIPSTRAELEDLIRCTLAKEARALREEDYSQARNFRETLEEWQSLRSILPTRDAMEQELKSLHPKLQDAIRQRHYNEAEVHRNRRNWLEKQLHREEEYLQVEERFQQARLRARDMSFQSGGSVCSRSSFRSHVSNASRTSCRSNLSRVSFASSTSCRSNLSSASRSSRRSHVSAVSRTSVRSQLSSFSRSGADSKRRVGGGTFRSTPRMFV